MNLLHRLLTIAGSNPPRRHMPAPRADVPESWAEGYLLGHSDTDARRYYERRNWRTFG